MTRKELFDWVKKAYGIEPDYPWQDWNAVLRHRDNRKWFGLVMEVERAKLGLPGSGETDVLNVKCDSRIIGSLRGQPGFLPAYHMNKEQWISILLDDTVNDEQTKELLQFSFELTRKKIHKNSTFSSNIPRH